MAQSFFDSILDATVPQIDACFGKQFVYRSRACGQAVALTAILSAHPMELDDEGKLIETAHSHDFEVNAADICFDGEVVLPRPGDSFVESMSDGTATVYEVMKNPKGRAYDPIDSEGARLLVYARETQRGLTG